MTSLLPSSSSLNPGIPPADTVPGVSGKISEKKSDSKVAEFDLVYKLNPVTHMVDLCCLWHDLEIRTCGNKFDRETQIAEQGVFAKRSIPRGSIIKYWGIYCHPNECGSKYGFYVNKNWAVDGDPVKVKERGLPLGINIAAFLNAPNQGEKSNCAMRNGKNYVVTVTDISVDQELLIRYGGSYRRRGY